MDTYLVKDVMSSPVASVVLTTRLPVSKRLLLKHNIRHLPAVEHDALIGIISLGDVRNAFPSDTALLSNQTPAPELDKVSAADIMRSDVITVAAQAPLAEAAGLLLSTASAALPVLEGS